MRAALAERDARTLAREILGVTQEEFSRAFKGSPMTRAKLRGLKRNAAVVLGNVVTTDDVDVLTRAIDDPEPLVREHAAWALGRIGSPAAAAALHDGLAVEPYAAVRAVSVAALDALAASARGAGRGSGPPARQAPARGTAPATCSRRGG